MNKKQKRIKVARAKGTAKPVVRRGGKAKKSKKQVEAYCVKCKDKRVMDNPTPATMKNGRAATKGECPECGTGMFRIGAV